MWQALGVVAVAIAGYGLVYQMLRRANHSDDRSDALSRELAAKTAELEAKSDALVVSQGNVEAMKREATALQTANRTLAAKLATAEKQRDDLLHVVETTPAGASGIAAALRVELDRMRKLSEAATSPASTASGDSDRREASVLHGGPTGSAPRP